MIRKPNANNKTKLKKKTILALALGLPFVAGIVTNYYNSPPAGARLRRIDSAIIEQKSERLLTKEKSVATILRPQGATNLTVHSLSYCNAENGYSGFNVTSVEKYCIARYAEIFTLPSKGNDRVAEVQRHVEKANAVFNKSEDSACNEFSAQYSSGGDEYIVTYIIPETFENLSCLEERWPILPSRDIATGYSPQLIKESGSNTIEPIASKLSFSNLVLAYQTNNYYSKTVWSQE